MDNLFCVIFDSPTSFLQLIINFGWGILALFGLSPPDLRGAIGDILGCVSY